MIYKISILLAVLVLTFVLFAPTPQQGTAPRLIMFHNPECIYCIKFLDEVCLSKEGEPDRDKTCPGYGWKQDTVFEKYPILVITHPVPDWIQQAGDQGKIKRVLYTPTFVLWSGEREVDRMEGYDNPEVFYKVLREMIEKDRPQKDFYRVSDTP